MESSSKVSSLLLICILFISTASPILGCPYCGTPIPKTPSHHKSPTTPAVPVPLPPVTVPIPPVTPLLPPIIPVTPVLPPIPTVPIPPVTPVLPPIPTVPIPPVTPLLPPIPTVPIPPVTRIVPVPLPPVPIVNPPATPSPGGKPCPPGGPAAQPSCPIDVLKLSGCVDVLGGLVHALIGQSVKSHCCPVITGLADAEAALCLCTTLKIKALNLNIYAPIALQVLLTCGKHPPPGFTCSI